MTKIPTGYLVGRSIDRQGPGPWWEYIVVTETFHQAFSIAQDFAQAARTHAWFQIRGDEYEPLTWDCADRFDP